MTRQNPPRDGRSLRRELADIYRRLRNLETTPRVGGWYDLTLKAGYSAANPAGGGGLGFGYLPQLRWLSRTQVELRGAIQKGTGAGGAGANGFAGGDSALTLPSEAWPAQIVFAPIRCSSGGGAASYGVAGSQISAAGVLTYQTGIANAPGWIALDGVLYDIE